MIAVVEAALARVEIAHAAASPRAICTCRSFDDNSIRYAVLYWLADPVFDLATDSQIRTHVFATLARHHMEMPLPRRVLLTPDAVSAQHDATSARELTHRLDVLSRLKLFAELTEGERRALAAELRDAPYVTGDVISREGEVSDSLFILAAGNVEIVRDASDALDERKHLADMAPPDHFGEMGLLTGQARSATVIAREDVLCYRLEKRGLMRFSRRGRKSPKRWRRWWQRAWLPTMRRCRRSMKSHGASARRGLPASSCGASASSSTWRNASAGFASRAPFSGR